MARVYFIGIGGSGMQPLAYFALGCGHSVSGSDAKLSPARKRELELAGIQAFPVHDADRIEPDDYDIVVYSSAIAEDHPEYRRAQEWKQLGRMRVLHRMAFLDICMEAHNVLFGVAGTHGKTSTASMIGWVLYDLGLDPSIVVGGRPLFLDSGVRNGKKDCGVYETDESDASFLGSRAPYRLILNIDRDHLDYYKTEEKLISAFRTYALEAGALAINADDDRLRALLPALAGNGPVVAFFTRPELNNELGDLAKTMRDLRPLQAEYLGETDEWRMQGSTASMRLPQPGRHYASNALGAFAILRLVRGLGVLPAHADDSALLASLQRFPGVARRMQLVGTHPGGAKVYDDYGHHPTEIRAVLAALRRRSRENERLIVCFQPHRFTRTRDLYREFAAELARADQVYLMPLYSAGESSIAGVSSQMIFDHMQREGSGRVHLLDGPDFDRVFGASGSGDSVVCLGAGSISEELLEYSHSWRGKNV